PASRSVGVALHVGSVDVLQPEAAAAATFSSVALDQVGVDREAGADAVGKLRRTIQVDCGVLAKSTIRTYALRDKPTAVGGQRRVCALIEDDCVVLDVTVV